ncbi:MAG TPA: AAA domain-containing protein [Verrucomicrobiae bacterium]|nr:AAA domain-containing protein [Verrucomicrobiae bacterium]
MNATTDLPFLTFLRSGLDRGGFETDDVLAAVLPLMEQVVGAHEETRVAPLQGIERVFVNAQGQLAIDATRLQSVRKNPAGVEKIQAPVSLAMEVMAESRHTSDLDAGSLIVASLDLNRAGEEITKPVYLPGYVSWEQAVGHHDELTDVFSLGLILASLACGLDFTELADLEAFVNNRENLFALNHRLNPVVASVIAQMTELNRHRREQDLRAVIRRLENYRGQTTDYDFDFTRIKGFRESGPTGKRKLIQAHLRDRLFEISRRNRLLHFKPTLQTLNLTIASVPLVLDYRNIRLEQLFIWHARLAATIAEGAPMALGQYLRFEDAPYIPGVLDKIISEARRDRAEFGFAQLRLVLCFLRWHNLKEEPRERIHSPLLLLPVELTKKKGVRDNYVLAPTTTEAEVNPVLRHHLKELYDLDLPETVDLRETSPDQFHELLRAQIQASEAGVTLNKVDRPRIELIHERARQRVDQYRRRMKVRARPTRSHGPMDYGYDRENFRPLGLQIFLEKVRPASAPLRDAAGAPPRPRLCCMAGWADTIPALADTGVPETPEGRAVETERRMFALREGDNQNPYSWDFDLCSITLGNFNYRKMTLVRDYTNLIETDLASAGFDTIFSLAPKAPEETPPPLDLADQYLIIPCDATQSSAIARARTGRSYIIQGPPGTGKSQTITNLIADYVARGQRVLFVCEKRAAIDIVFHRLRQQGLDELCCLIHDSQTDKKAFIQDLKQTYEKLLGESVEDDDAETDRQATLRAMEQDLAGLRRFSEAMGQVHPLTGVPLRTLLHRLVETGGRKLELPPELEERLPDYPLWLQHGELVMRLAAALADLGEEPCFAKQPLRWLGKALLQADCPLETLSASLDKAEDLLDAVESALDLSGLPPELWDTLEEIEVILGFAVRVRTLAEKDLLGLLDPHSATATAYAALETELAEHARALQLAREKTAAWKEPLSPEDTQNALAQAGAFEKSPLRFFQPAFWRLRKALRTRYDFGRHAVAPAWVKILGDLAAAQQAAAAHDDAQRRAQREWRVDDPAAFQQFVADLRADPVLSHPSVSALSRKLVESAEGRMLVESLADIHARFAELVETLRFLLAEHEGFDFPGLAETLGALREQTNLLPELLPVLCELAELPEPFGHALRHAPLALDEFEPAMARKSLNQVYRQDRALSRLEGRSLAQRMERLETHYRQWLGRNAAGIRARVRRRFLEHVSISSLVASQLDAEQKVFKKNYSAGRRDLEHEFGKTMRYKSIRDLAAGNSGLVIRDLKPVWLMSPLSVSDTLPLEPDLFDVVIFDEASQIPLEEAIPALHRANQAIVVGDEMQLPPTAFFSAGRPGDDSVVVEEEGERVEVDLDSDSFLTQSAVNLPSTLLAWHYRSRYESLISFSNAAFYSGNLFTIPDRQRALAGRAELRVAAVEEGEANVDAVLRGSISFHFMENGIYDQRRNATEAAYIARLVRALLRRETKSSVGIVAFSEAQQTEIEDALSRLAEEDDDFAARLEAEYAREENDQFCGLIVKNLENVQGDERDIVILSICYGYDANRRMLMNFGPINQRGGEKRLNVIFSRARHHMAIVSSIRHNDITNDFNDGANSLKNFLHYAEAISKGDDRAARRVLENLNPLTRKSLAPETGRDAVIEELAGALRARGHVVELRVGQSKFRCDLAVRAESDDLHQIGILVDTDAHYANPNLLDRYLMQPSILRAFGWRFALVLTKDWFHDPETVLKRVERTLKGHAAPEDEPPAEPDQEETEAPAAARGRQSARKAAPETKDNTGGAPGTDRPESAGTKRNVEPPPASRTPPSLAPSGTTRRFEFIGGASRKFWEIAMDGNAFTVRFGRIGTAGQTQSKTFADAAQAKREADKLIGEKLKKGYVESV